VPSTSCPCGPDEYYCELPGYGCSVLNILGKASYITSKNQPGYWNDLDMLEVGNGGMTTAEYRTHMTMWAAIKSPLIMGNKLDQLSVEDYQILTNPAILALSQDPVGSAVQRRVVKQVEPKDEYGFGEVQIWSGQLYGGDYVVIFLNAANDTQDVEVPLWQVFGLITAAQAEEDWATYDLWAENVTISADVASMVLNGTMELSSSSTDGTLQGYYNATEMSWEAGIMANDTRLLGSYAGMVSAGATVQASVDSHDVKAWRFRSMGKGASRKRDEL
jgi:alpha-galactosidase